MIEKIRIQNFKSIVDLEIEPGKLNVIIGENGCGKSSFLEAFAYLSAAFADRLEGGDLIDKGVRLAKPSQTVNAFPKLNRKNKYEIEFELNVSMMEGPFDVKLSVSKDDLRNISYEWDRLVRFKTQNITPFLNFDSKKDEFKKFMNDAINSGDLFKDILPKTVIETEPDIQTEIEKPENKNLIQVFMNEFMVPMLGKYTPVVNYLKDYLVYQFETNPLRGMGFENHVLPLGINGEGLDQLLITMANEEKELYQKVTETVGLVSWVENIELDEENKLKNKGYGTGISDSKLYFKDKFMDKKRNSFSAENANEGVLHLLACIAATVSRFTPKFFAIDNVDAGLNPLLCRKMIEEMEKLLKKNDKQVILTTHNPAILDGLNLNEDTTRLFVMSRNNDGHTQLRRLKYRAGMINDKVKKVKLSEMWMNGNLGGLPTHFEFE